MRILRSVQLLGEAMTVDGKVRVHVVVTEPGPIQETVGVHLTTIPIESTAVARQLAAALLREADGIESGERGHARTH